MQCVCCKAQWHAPGSKKLNPQKKKAASSEEEEKESKRYKQATDRWKEGREEEENGAGAGYHG